MGMPQFISSSYRNYAIDFDNDGIADIWDNPNDVIGGLQFQVLDLPNYGDFIDVQTTERTSGLLLLTYSSLTYLNIAQ